MSQKKKKKLWRNMYTTLPCTTTLRGLHDRQINWYTPNQEGIKVSKKVLPPLGYYIYNKKILTLLIPLFALTHTHLHTHHGSHQWLKKVISHHTHCKMYHYNHGAWRWTKQKDSNGNQAHTHTHKLAHTCYKGEKNRIVIRSKLLIIQMIDLNDHVEIAP